MPAQVGGFRGWVVTDWGAQHDSVLAANSGLDQEMEWNQGSNTTRYGQIGFANKQFKEVSGLRTTSLCSHHVVDVGGDHVDLGVTM